MGAIPGASRLTSLEKISEADKNTNTGTEAGDGDKQIKTEVAGSSKPHTIRGCGAGHPSIAK